VAQAIVSVTKEVAEIKTLVDEVYLGFRERKSSQGLRYLS
jgi:hypothetical protein